MVGSVSEPNATRDTSRSDALIATFVGVCALLVSGYIAYMQGQHVRAAVWPILEFDTSNAPDIHNASAWKMRLRLATRNFVRLGQARLARAIISASQ